MHVNRNVTFKLENLETITGFMNKTKQNFSATLNIVIEQWDKFSVVIAKWERDQETKKELERFDQQKKMDVIKK